MKRLTLPQAAAYVAERNGGARPHYATILRWVKRGVRGYRLKAEPMGYRWFTWDHAIDDFLAKQAAAAAVSLEAGPVRAAQVHAAVDELDSMLEPAKRKAVPK